MMMRTSGAAAAIAVATLLSPAGTQPPEGTPSTGARIELTAFAYQRRIPPGAPGVSWLRLDLAALSHSRLADIRIVSRDGFQVPYLLEDDSTPLRVTLPPLAAMPDEGREGRAARKGGQRSVYSLALPYSRMPSCRLVLETTARVFEREVILLAGADGARGPVQGRWQARIWRTWRHTDPDVPSPPLTIELPSLDATTTRLVVDEGDNLPLPLERPVLELRTWRLRFVRETGEELWLAYGRRELGAPRYDLALLESRLKGEWAGEVSAEPERTAAGNAAVRPTLIFWTVLVAAVVALIALVARLLRPTSV